MIQTFSGCDGDVAGWVQAHIPGCLPFDEKVRTLGILRDGQLIAGVVYSEFRGHQVEGSMASTDPRWATRPVLYNIFAYPFVICKVRRFQVTVSRRNKHTRRFVERLGFVYCGKGRKAMPDGSDACVYDMLPWEAERWLNWRKTDE